MCVSCRTRVPSCRCVPVPDGACYAGGMRRKGRRVCVRLSGDASPSLWQSPSNSVGRVSAACTLTCLLRPTTSMFRARAQSIAPFFVFQTWRLFVCCMCSVFVCVAQCRALLSVSVAVWHMHHVRPDRASTFLCLSLMLVCLCVSVTCTPQEATARRMDVQGTCPSAVSFRPRRSAFGRARAAVRVGVVDCACARILACQCTWTETVTPHDGSGPARNVPAAGAFFFQSRPFGGPFCVGFCGYCSQGYLVAHIKG